MQSFFKIPDRDFPKTESNSVEFCAKGSMAKPTWKSSYLKPPKASAKIYFYDEIKFEELQNHIVMMTQI